MCIWIGYNRGFCPAELMGCSGALQGPRLWAFLDRTYGPNRQSGFRIIDALALAARLDSSDPRDKVFATLGIMKRFSNVAKLPRQLMPNYRKPVREVLRDAVRQAIYEEGDLNMILLSIYHAAATDVQSHDLPTWVPRELLYKGQRDISLSRSFRQGDRHARFGFCSSYDVLSLGGFLLGRVQKQTRSLLTGKRRRAEIQFWLIEAWTLALSCRSLRCDRFASAIVRLLLAGIDIEHDPLQDGDTYGFDDFLLRLFHDQKVLFYLHAAQESSNASAEDKAAASFYESLQWACKHRRLLILDDGVRGIGPAAMIPGDVVAIIHGTDHPYVLRKVGGHFLVVGHCYIEGVITGQAALQGSGPDRVDEYFHIR